MSFTGRKHAPATLVRMSIAQKGRVVTPEARRKLRKANLGKIISEETKQKISNALRDRIGGPSITRGVPKSQSHRRKISEALKGRIFTAEHRRNISIASRLRGAGKHERTKESRKRSSRSVIKFLQSKPGDSRKDTSIEKAVQQELKRARISFSSNVPIAGFLVDIYIPSHKLVVECDGCYWHCCPHCRIHNYKPDHLKDVRRRDRKRNQRLKDQGYQILRFWQHDIENHIDQCINQIYEAIR